ncbi:MAG: hypothetical protein A4S17_09565 [Proteobacteria bacterium HN_bin10]|nr:MAG: hypothetical protein A4S17_09565 [Proteobacteria bacterium HN_bin10]
MPWFRLFALGEDFPVIIDGNVEIVGFYTTRYVEAASASEAEAIASDLLFEDEDLQPPPGYEDIQPRLVFEEIEQVAEPIDIDDNFSFFPMDEDEDA